MKSDTMTTTLIRFNVLKRWRIAGSSAVRPGRGDSSQHRSSTAHAAARDRRGGWCSMTASAKARNPVLIWSATAENSNDAVMNVIVSRFDRRPLPRRIDRETSIASITFISRSACVCRTNGAFMRAVTFQSMRRTSSP